MIRRRPTAQMTREYKRAKLVQLLTYRERLDNVSAADLAHMSGVPEPECAVALERERLFRRARQG